MLEFDALTVIKYSLFLLYLDLLGFVVSGAYITLQKYILNKHSIWFSSWLMEWCSTHLVYVIIFLNETEMKNEKKENKSMEKKENDISGSQLTHLTTRRKIVLVIFNIIYYRYYILYIYIYYIHLCTEFMNVISTRTVKFPFIIYFVFVYSNYVKLSFIFLLILLFMLCGDGGTKKKDGKNINIARHFVFYEYGEL